MFCSNCGKENRNDRKFCTECGAKLRDYTKPRENLLMPEDIEDAKHTVKRNNSIKLVCGIIMFIIFAVAIGFTIASIFVNEDLKVAFSITSLCLLVAFFIVWIAKDLLTKQTKKKTKKTDNK